MKKQELYKITHKGEVRGVQVKGINPKLESSVTSLHQQIVDGDLNEISIPKFGVSIGKSLAKKLNVPFGFKLNGFVTTKPKNGYTANYLKTKGNPNELLGKRKD